MLYIGNHTSSSKGYAAMGRQIVKNGGNTFAFLPEIQEEEKPKTLIRRMCRHFCSWQRRIIWKAGGSCALHYELLRCQGKPQGFCKRNHGR